MHRLGQRDQDLGALLVAVELSGLAVAGQQRRAQLADRTRSVLGGQAQQGLPHAGDRFRGEPVGGSGPSPRHRRRRRAPGPGPRGGPRAAGRAVAASRPSSPRAAARRRRPATTAPTPGPSRCGPGPSSWWSHLARSPRPGPRPGLRPRPGRGRRAGGTAGPAARCRPATGPHRSRPAPRPPPTCLIFTSVPPKQAERLLAARYGSVCRVIASSWHVWLTLGPGPTGPPHRLAPTRPGAVPRLRTRCG